MAVVLPRSSRSFREDSVRNRKAWLRLLKHYFAMLILGVTSSLAFRIVEVSYKAGLSRSTHFGFGKKSLKRSNLILIEGSSTQSRTLTAMSINEPESMKNRAFIAVGSNLGDRYHNIASAITLLCDQAFDGLSSPPARLVRTSFLYETAPMYMTDQSWFLNGAIEIETNLQPHSLLNRVKNVEGHLGRNFSTARNGPRPIDLDILFYEDLQDCKGSGSSSILVDSPDLVIPHPRVAEREFVLAPLCDVTGPDYRHPNLNETIGDLYKRLIGENTSGKSDVIRGLPLPRGRMIAFNETVIMGVLNVTPDSFSDGGSWDGSIDVAVERALEMEAEGAGIIDIGGESTRPGAKEISLQEQIQRTIPVIKKIRQVSDVPISIDTRHAGVARAAIEAGADIVNDVSAGMHDKEMLSTVAELGVPFIAMHMRGTPESMQKMTDYDDVVKEVSEALLERSIEAETAGIPRWLQVVDPGIGFAKDMNQNLLLLKHLSTLRSLVGDIPILLGTSRKGFIGKITGEKEPKERDYGTVASCVAALSMGEKSMKGCNIIRVHNVKAMKQAAMIMDAIQAAR